MKLKKLFALALAVCMMALAVPAAFAAGLTLDYGTTPVVVESAQRYSTYADYPVMPLADDSVGDDSLKLFKTVAYDKVNDVANIKLEAYTVGSAVTKPVPTDIVLVLDESKSMESTTFTYEKVDVSNTNQLDIDTTYYIKQNNSYTTLSYCDEATGLNQLVHPNGWWTGFHFDIWGVQLHWGERFRGTDIGNYDVYVRKNSSQSKIDTLKSAAKGFIEKIATDAAPAPTGNDVDHKVAVIRFSDTATDRTDGLLDIRTNYSKIEKAINDLSLQTGTANIADALVQAKATLGDPVEGRNRVVVLFTNVGDYDTDTTSTTLFDRAIATAKSIKVNAQTNQIIPNTFIYTVGLMDQADPSLDVTSSDANQAADQKEVQINRLMQYVSSNYSFAESLTVPGTKTGSVYYVAASNSASYEGIFTSILTKVQELQSSSEIGLNATAKLIDGIMPQFVAPNKGDISVKTYNCESYNENTGVATWYDTDKGNNGITVDINNGNVIVTGFNYNNYFLTGEAKNNNTDAPHGRKIVIEFSIARQPDFLGGSDLYTNTDVSGIYASNGTTVFGIFNRPTVDVPVKDVTPTVQNQTIYLSNTADLTSLMTGFDTQGRIDGTNNDYVVLTYALKDSENNTVATYEIPVGETSGEWDTPITAVTGITSCTPYTLSCTVNGGAYDDGTENKAESDPQTATVHVLKPTVEAGETTTYISNTVSLPADTAEDKTVYDGHVTAWTDTTKDHAPAGVNVQPSVPDENKLTWEFYDGETKVEQYTATNKECKELTAVLCINGNNYEKLYRNTYTVHVLTPNLKADSTEIYLGDDTNLNRLVQWNNWNACTHGKATSDDLTIPSASCMFEGVVKPEAYTDTTCRKLTATWTSGNYSTSAQFDVHVLWPTISVADDTIYLGDTSKLTASISGWTCDKHEDVTADRPTTGEFDFYDENGVEVTDWTVSPHDCTEYTAKLDLGVGEHKKLQKSFWVHVLTAGVTVDDQVIYLSDSVTAKDATITWQNECDAHKRTVAAEEEPLSYTVVFSEDGNTISVDACGSYTAYLKVGNTVYKEEEFKDSFDVHVLEPQIRADSFAMYLSNNVNLNERQYITEWKCSDKTEKDVTEGRVKPSVAYDFYQNITGTAEENTSAYAPAEDVTLTVVVKVNGNEYQKKYQGTFTIDVLEPIFSVNQKEVWANYLSIVDVYTQYGNEVKSVAWDNTTYAIVGEEPEDVSCTFELEKIAGDGDWDKTDATKYQTGTNEDTFKVVKATWTYADGKSFVATGDRVKCNDLYDFIIHTNKFQLTINTDWTNSDGEEQGSIFTVTPVNQEDKNLKPITVAIPKGESSVVITGLFSGQRYTIAEDNGWTWRYGTAAEAEGDPSIYCAGGSSLADLNEKDDVKMSFDDGETYNAKWLSSEDCVINNAATRDCTIPERKEDDEEVTNA